MGFRLLDLTAQKWQRARLVPLMQFEIIPCVTDTYVLIQFVRIFTR
jgi:hypothetical protein